MSALAVEIPYDRQAQAIAVRLLADALAAKVPGGSVEVRVPPFAVVQCVEGPRHTRGTPPNVVECDPVAFIELCTGRLTSGLGGDPHEVTCPWCGGSGRFEPGRDAQEHPAERPSS